MNNYAPLQGVAQDLAQHGRYGDSMLVHMNPIEVQGIAALSPTGQLTTNPVTGQQEAFLPFLAPLLGSALGLGTMGTSLLGAGLTTLATGDLKKGIMSGLMGFGIGKAFEGLGALGDSGDVISTTVEADPSSLLPVTGPSPTGGGFTSLRSGTGPTEIPTGGGKWLESQFSPDTTTTTPWWGREGPTLGGVGGQETLGMGDIGDILKGGMTAETIIPLGIGAQQYGELEQQDAMNRFAKERGLEDEEERRKWENIMQEGFQQSRADYPYAPYNRGGIVSVNPADYARRRNGFNTLGVAPVQMQGGGETAAFRQARIRGPRTITPEELAAAGRPGFGPEITYFQPRRVGVTDADVGAGAELPADIDLSSLSGFYGTGYGNLFGNYNVPLQPSPVSDARSLIERDYGDNGTISDDDAGIAADAAVNYVAGTPPVITPPSPSGSLEEILAEIQRPTLAPAPPPPVMAGPPPTEAGPTSPVTAAAAPPAAAPPAAAGPPPPPAATPPPQQVESPIPPENQQAASAYLAEWTPEQQAELEAALAALGRSGFQEGGPTDIPVGPEQEAPVENAAMDQLIDQTEMAILGQLPPEQAEIVIAQFINVFGEEVFQMLREQVLQGVAGPGAQTQGIVQGQGGGMDDQVPGMIGNQQPVAVSPGEFIVPADVVSGLGDGSSDAGADKLDTMMNQVRMAKTGGIVQPKRISSTVLPV